MLGEKFHGCDILYGIVEAVTLYALYGAKGFACCSENKQYEKRWTGKGVKQMSTGSIKIRDFFFFASNTLARLIHVCRGIGIYTS